MIAPGDKFGELAQGLPGLGPDREGGQSHLRPIGQTALQRSDAENAEAARPNWVDWAGTRTLCLSCTGLGTDLYSPASFASLRLCVERPFAPS